MKSEKINKAHRLSRANYLPRVVGFAASFIMVALIIIEREWSYWNILFLGFYFLVYPHIVYLASKHSANGKRVEISAMMIDAAFLGLWSAHINFVLWITYVFLSATVLNNMMVGGWRQLLKSLVLFLSAVLIWGTVVGFQLDLQAPLYIEAIAMASLLLYITSVAWTFYHVNDRLANMKMQQEVKNRELEETLVKLDATRDELVENAHKAGMADIATGVLHNIGNVLNSITTSTSITNDVLKKTKLEKFFQASQLLKENKDNLEHFLTADPTGKKLVEYFIKLEKSLRKELEILRSHNQRLDQKTAMISDVIATQQNYATVGLNYENSKLNAVIEDTLTIFSASMERHQIKVEKNIQETAPVHFQKTKLVHVLLNLIKNAKEATEACLNSEKVISIKLYQKDDEVFLEISDNGYGIKKENMDKIFTHGFTTKFDGHGFGLHSSANYLTEMGAKIQVSSKGEGENFGATFKITFPVANTSYAGKMKSIDNAGLNNL